MPAGSRPIRTVPTASFSWWRAIIRSRAARAIRLRVQLRSFDGVCRLVERNVGVGIVPETTARWAAQTLSIKAVQLTDHWALRDLSICVRDYKALPPYARQLVDHMR